MVYLGTVTTLATLGCQTIWFAWADLFDLILWPKGELFSPLSILDAFKHLKLSGFIVISIVIGASGCFSYFGYS